MTGLASPQSVVGFPLETTPLNTRIVAAFYLAGAVGLGLSALARDVRDTRIFVAGVPAGVALHRVLMPAMAGSAGIRLPEALLEVYRPWLLLALATGGLLIAVVGALLPAGWAARLRTATALRTE